MTTTNNHLKRHKGTMLTEEEKISTYKFMEPFTKGSSSELWSYIGVLPSLYFLYVQSLACGLLEESEIFDCGLGGKFVVFIQANWQSIELSFVKYSAPIGLRVVRSLIDRDVPMDCVIEMWSKIASHFPGCTDNEIKNHWNTRIKKRLKLLGVDPVSHKPIEQQEDEENRDDPNIEFIDATRWKLGSSIHDHGETYKE
ncbi:hypothetical protein RHMOL_Rhmol10G0016800 [Rhododendron molle]|uniref:Uncharacterized protein n=1 Tax=Rhododendron molle TaxID=49168 RepID=A0ACC0LZ07_RHOML|nr:hypothetical protein RHMOL_Rhmol10G0016800 [Rhododendron molle]